MPGAESIDRPGTAVAPNPALCGSFVADEEGHQQSIPTIFNFQDMSLKTLKSQDFGTFGPKA